MSAIPSINCWLAMRDAAGRRAWRDDHLRGPDHHTRAVPADGVPQSDRRALANRCGHQQSGQLRSVPRSELSDLGSRRCGREDGTRGDAAGPFTENPLLLRCRLHDGTARRKRRQSFLCDLAAGRRGKSDPHLGAGGFWQRQLERPCGPRRVTTSPPDPLTPISG